MQTFTPDEVLKRYEKTLLVFGGAEYGRPVTLWSGPQSGFADYLREMLWTDIPGKGNGHTRQRKMCL
jgi:hypothetical protein